MRSHLRGHMRRVHVLVILALVLSLTGSATFAVTPARAITFYTVNTLTDELDGNCTLPDDCSLRDALDLSGTNDVINFSVTGTINLTLGELVVDHNIGIAGPGADDLTINAGDLSRIFSMGAQSVSLSGLTLTGGNHGAEGGALYMYGAGLWTLSDMVITDNQAGAPAEYNFGGAIYMFGGTLTITNSEISYNTLVSGTGTTQGGALYAGGGTLNLTNVTFAGNHGGTGGGMGEGGAAMLGNGLTANINNSTFAGNDAGNSGGGLIVHSSATAISLKNTLIADNTAPSGPDCAAPVLAVTSEDYNLIETTSGCTISGTTTHNVYGRDPGLLPLDTYGSNTRSMAPGAGSPAIDAGNDATCAGTDQRGSPRPAGAHCDIGAFEVQVLTVTKTADTADGTCDSDCSLREAMIAAAPASLVNFALSGTFPLGSALPNIEKVITIDGSGQDVILDGQNANRIFNIWSGDLTAKQLTLTRGLGTDGGGAVAMSGGAATFEDVTFTDNAAGDGVALYSSGGAVSVIVGTLNLIRSTLSDNSAVSGSGGQSRGGAVYNQGTLTIINSTLTGNSADYGGAVHNNYGSLTAINSTFSGNTGILEGGAISTVGDGFVLNLANTILANSTSGYDCYVQFGNATITNVGSLIENNFLCGTPAFTTDPQLGNLADNTGLTQTMALLAGSAAIDAGDPATCAATDQRGISRPRNGTCDIGAYEKIPYVPSDFDDDATTDPVKFDSANSAWWLRSSDGSWDGEFLGPGTYVGRSDFDGDGKTDPAKFDANSLWYVKSSNGAFTGEYMGPGTYTFVAGSDYEGDGKTDPAQFNTAVNALWYYGSNDSAWHGIYLGPGTYSYVTGSDFDGDGKSDPAHFDSASNVLWYQQSSTSTWIGTYLGPGTYSYVEASDFDGDGMTDPAQFTGSSNTLWYIPSGGGGLTGVWMGGTPLSYVPAADFDGDGMTDPAGFDSAAHLLWYLPSGGGGWSTFDMEAGTYTIVN